MKMENGNEIEIHFYFLLIDFISFEYLNKMK